MNIVKDIEAFLSSEALRSRELFSRFALLHKQEEWYYVGTHPAPPGVTPVQGPRRAWRWNATLARRQGATEESIAAAVKGKTAEQATAQAVAIPVSEATPVDAELSDFVGWEEWAKGLPQVSGAELKPILRQQQAIGMGNGKESGTVFASPFAKIRKTKDSSGKEITQIVSVTTADGQLIPIRDTAMADGRITRANVQFNASSSAKYQYRYDSADIDHFVKTGKNRLAETKGTSVEFNKGKAGRKFGKLADLTDALPDIRATITRDLRKPQALSSTWNNGSPMGANTVRGAAFAAALIDHTFKRVGGGVSWAVKDGKEGRPFGIDADRKKEGIKGLKKKGDKYSVNSKGQIFRTPSRGKDKGKKVDVTPYTKYRRETYGITTFLSKHIKVDSDGAVRLDFPGKEGIRNNVKVTDPFLAKQLTQRKKALESQGPQGKKTNVVGVKEGSVNTYLKTISGKDISAHKFRHYHATRLALEAVDSIGDAPSISTQEFNKKLITANNAKKRADGEGYSKNEIEDIARAIVKDLQNTKVIDTVGRRVAPHLSHEPEESVKTYIDPNVWDESGWNEQFVDEQDKYAAKNLLRVVNPPKKRKSRKKTAVKRAKK